MIASKPSGTYWTDDQWRAIASRNKQILVAAAAGSGKTAVLVERIIRRILDEKIDVSQLLVLTFTNAAASQMKQRVRSALQDIEIQDAFIAEQLTMLESSDISTFHAFCLSLIRQNYYLLELDPNFRIGDDVELQLLIDEAMSTTLERAYTNPSPEFLSFVDSYTTTRSDDQLADFIQMVYKMVQAQPDGLHWLDNVYHQSEQATKLPIDQQPAVIAAKNYIQDSLESVAHSFFELAQSPRIPSTYPAFFITQHQKMNNLFECESWEELRMHLASYDWGRMPAVKADDKDAAQEQAKSRFDELKKTVNKLREDYSVFTEEQYLMQSQAVLPQLQALIQLVKAYDQQFKTRKQNRILVDFNDIEHYTLQLLRHFPQVRAMYQERFAEILVDEYQDTNGVQEAIIQLLIGEDTSLFLVGDMKQSIYKFRMADPSLFQAKYDYFETSDASENLRIDLNYNFRSRAEVLDTANFICKQLFSTQFDGIAYDDAAQLYVGNTSYPEARMDTEVLFIDMHREANDDDELVESSQSQMQAQVIAKKIEQLITSGFEVYDKKRKQMRPVEHRDIVILTRSRGALVNQLEREMRQLQIPAYAESLGGYFNSVEVRNMLSLLQIIDNPYQDIAFVGLLRSPIFGFDENELLTIRVNTSAESFYECASEYLQAHADTKLANKIATVLERINAWQQAVRLQPLTDFINQLFTETSYYQFVGGLPNGKLRQANLDILLNRAKSFEQSGYRGIYKFNNLISRLQELNKDLNNARTVADNENVVRIMTIHASKGLEFPVVIFADLQKQLNMSDLRGDCFVHQDLGIALSYVNVNERYKMTTLQQQIIKDIKRTEQIAEELRVLYVALTRAQEKVILTMTLDDIENNKFLQPMNTPEWQLPFHLVRESRRYSDWVMRAIARHNSYATFVQAPIHNQQWSEYPVQLQYQLINAKAELQTQFTTHAQSVSEIQFPQTVFPDGHETIVFDSFNFQYPQIEQTRHFAKQSVSEIKRMAQDAYFGTMTTPATQTVSTSFVVPDFMAATETTDPHPKSTRSQLILEPTVTARLRGIYYHSVLQHIDLSRQWSEPEFNQFIDNLIKEQKITEQVRSVIQYQQLQPLFESQVHEWMQAATRIRKELPFSLLVEAERVYPEWNGPSVPVLVQGIMDAVLELSDRIILIDYKTDKIREQDTEASLRARYRIQLELYLQAIHQAYPGRKIEGYLYFVDNGQLIQAL